MPAIRSKSSPATCCVLPTPDEANVKAPGYFFASSISSLTLFAGTEGCTTSTLGT